MRNIHNGLKKKCKAAFTLIEVTLALGILAYCLLALMGLFAVGLNSSSESHRETALSQIVQHASSLYPGGPPGPSAFNYEGISEAESGSGFQEHYSVTLNAIPSDPGKIPDTTDDLHLLTISITSINKPGVTEVFQTAVYVPPVP